MNQIKYMLVISLMLLSISAYTQNHRRFTDNEESALSIFKNFKSYLVSIIEKDVELSDTSQIKYVLLNYIMSESSLDTLNKNHFKQNEISFEKFNHFLNEYKKFHQYFYERKHLNIAQHLSALPIRLSSDKCMYEKLIPFQQQNTLVYFDDRYPEKILGYMLFIPKLKDVISAPRIWSWTLQFEAGHWAFRSPMGTVGIEYFISEGIEGPEHPIGN